VTIGYHPRHRALPGGLGRARLHDELHAPASLRAAAWVLRRKPASRPPGTVVGPLEISTAVNPYGNIPWAHNYVV
jgi:hypothetical protein